MTTLIQLKNKLLTRIAISILLASNTTIQCADQQDIKLPSMVGVNNKIFAEVIAYLKKELSDDDLQSPKKSTYNNRLLLYGKTGNGKSTLPQEIAKAANCEIITLRGPTIVGAIINTGSKRIEDAFSRAISDANEQKKPVIVFVDYVDAIASFNESASRVEHKKAQKTLEACLDAVRNDRRIFFICATDSLDTLNDTFRKKFESHVKSDSRLIELPNPSPEMREKIIKHYAAVFNLTLDATILNSMVEETAGLSIRAIEAIIRQLREELIVSA